MDEEEERDVQNGLPAAREGGRDRGREGGIERSRRMRADSPDERSHAVNVEDCQEKDMSYTDHHPTGRRQRETREERNVAAYRIRIHMMYC